MIEKTFPIVEREIQRLIGLVGDLTQGENSNKKKKMRDDRKKNAIKGLIPRGDLTTGLKYSMVITILRLHPNGLTSGELQDEIIKLNDLLDDKEFTKAHRTTVDTHLNRLKGHEEVIRDDSTSRWNLAPYSIFRERHENLDPLPKLVDIKMLAKKNEQFKHSYKADMQGFRVFAMELAKYAEKSFCATCVNPPKFWMAGDYLFCWDEFTKEPKDYEKKLTDYIHEKAGGIDLNGSIDHWDNSETNIVTAIISKDQSIFVKLMDEYASISCTPSLGIHKELRLVTKEDKEAKKTYIYSGDFDEIGWYKYYLTLVNNLKLDKKIRVLITDDSGSSGNPEDWEKEPKEKEHGMKNEIIDEFANYYNKTMTLYIGPKSKADGAYKCDITIIDEKRALIYEPEEKAEGKAIGRLTYICGDIVKEYLELFDQKNIEQAGWNSAYKLWCIEENPVSGNR